MVVHNPKSVCLSMATKWAPSVKVLIVKFSKLYKTFLFSTFSLYKKMKFSIKDCFSKCDQSRKYLRIWSHLLKKSLTVNVIFCGVFYVVLWKSLKW